METDTPNTLDIKHLYKPIVRNNDKQKRFFKLIKIRSYVFNYLLFRLNDKNIFMWTENSHLFA